MIVMKIHMKTNRDEDQEGTIMSHAKLKVVGESKKRMYGPRCLLVCGFSPDQRMTILNMTKNKKLKNMPVVFTTGKDRFELVENMVIREHQIGLDSACELEHTIIMSGLTEKELHQTMAAYKKLKLPKPLWATLTPTSEKWTVEALVNELANERLSFEK
jgi:uncharacterized protein DUF3783